MGIRTPFSKHEQAAKLKATAPKPPKPEPTLFDQLAKAGFASDAVKVLKSSGLTTSGIESVMRVTGVNGLPAKEAQAYSRLRNLLPLIQNAQYRYSQQQYPGVIQQAAVPPKPEPFHISQADLWNQIQKGRLGMALAELGTRMEGTILPVNDGETVALTYDDTNMPVRARVLRGVLSEASASLSTGRFADLCADQIRDEIIRTVSDQVGYDPAFWARADIALPTIVNALNRNALKILVGMTGCYQKQNDEWAFAFAVGLAYDADRDDELGDHEDGIEDAAKVLLLYQMPTSPAGLSQFIARSVQANTAFTWTADPPQGVTEEIPF